MHRTLLRQLKRTLGVADAPALSALYRQAREAAQGTGVDPALAALLAGFGALIERVDESYEQADRDLALCGRSLELSSAELNAANTHLRAQLAERAHAIRRLRDVLGLLDDSEPDGGVAGDDIDALTRRVRELMRERESQRVLLRNLVGALPDPVWLKDEHGVYLDCNPCVEELLGRPRAAIIGRTDYDLFDREQADFFRAHDRKALERGGASVNEEWLSYADGRRRLVETTKTPLRDEVGRLIGVLGIAHDITERREAEAALRQSEQRFRGLFEQVPSISVQGYDAERRVIFWNRASERLYGYSATDALGRRLEELIIPEAMCAGVVRAVDGWVAGGDPIPAGELLLRRKDGGAVPVFSSHVMSVGQGGEREMYCIDIDLTELKRAQARLQLAASVFTHAWEGIMITDPDGRIVEVNDAFTRITGYAREQVIGNSPRILRSGRHGAAFYAAMWRDLLGKGYWHGEVWNRRADGEDYPELLTISTVRDGEGRVLHYVGLFADLSAQKAHEAELEYLANHDVLTQLPNRALLHDRLEQAMAQAHRRERHLALAYVDLDGFKLINDEHGHEMGDQLLRALAAQMKSTLREGDTIARLGGDEFAAVLVDLPARADFVPFVERLLAALARPVVAGGYSMQVSASIGITLYPQAEGVDPDQLLRQADLAMYQAKLAGKNRYHVFDTELDRSVRDLHETLACIRRGLERDEFVLFYQPKVNLRSGRVTGAEALIRWQHPQRGLLLPAAFLAAVEHHALGVELGEWVLRRALAQLSAWGGQGLTLTVSVNIAATHLQRADFVLRLRALLAEHPDVPAARLQLEVLETSALEDMAHVSSVIEACRALGVSFALDDFGTGYSSLTYLKRLPVQVLKIDQSFVRDMLDDPDDLAILEGVLGLARAFGREAVAEGVETVRHAERLLQLGCEQAQGYGIARPMPAAEVSAWVAAWRPDPAWCHAPPLGPAGLALLRATVHFRAWWRRLGDSSGGRRGAALPLSMTETPLARWLVQACAADAGAEEAPRRLAECFARAVETSNVLLGNGAGTDLRPAEVARACEAVMAAADEVLRDGRCR